MNVLHIVWSWDWAKIANAAQALAFAVAVIVAFPAYRQWIEALKTRKEMTTANKLQAMLQVHTMISSEESRKDRWAIIRLVLRHGRIEVYGFTVGMPRTASKTPIFLYLSSTVQGY